MKTLEQTAAEARALRMLRGLANPARFRIVQLLAERKESGMEIRDAANADAAAIARIYNQGIEDRVATLETQLRTSEERAEWMARRGPRHPVLVAVDAAGAVVGWASL